MDKVNNTVRTYITDDHDSFNYMPGNRNVDELHVKQLIRQIKKEGNLIDQFPIVVNENMEIIDGQHRLEALRQLGEPVVYEIRKGLTIKDVRTINTTHRNWSWKDYAISYADLGNDDYQRLINLEQYFGFGFSVLMAYCGQVGDRRRSKNFYDGSFKIENQEKTFKLLKQLQQLVEVIGVDRKDFDMAMLPIFNVDGYDHQRMLEKMKKHGKHKLAVARGIPECQRVIEDIYNTGVVDAEKVRLF